MRISKKNGLVICFLSVTLGFINPCYADLDYSGVNYSNPTPGYALMAAGGAGVLASLLAIFLTSAKGDNLAISNTPVVNDKLSILLNPNSQDLHLGYRSVKVQNNSNSALTMSKVSVKIPNSLSGKIKFCAVNDGTCRYKTDSNCIDNGILDMGGGCRIWFKALNNDADGVTTASGAIDVQVIVDSYEYSKSFNVAYEKALYVGGNFTLAGGNSAYNLAKWNGSVWANVSGGTDGQINALAVGADEDLYVGGKFASAGGVPASNIAKWNGVLWLPLGSGVDNTVNAIASDANGDVYVGGKFASTEEKAVLNLAKWNGASWLDIGGTSGDINALKVVNGYLYVVGRFDYVSGPNSSDVAAAGAARWQINTALWDVIGVFSDFDYYALSSYGEYVFLGGKHKDGYFYVDKLSGSSEVTRDYGGADKGNKIFAIAATTDGGAYIGGAGDNILFGENIAKWDGRECSEYNTNECLKEVGGGVNGVVRALVKEGSALYVGGDFTSAGSNSANRVALWDGTSWKALGDGLDGSVRALTTLASIKLTE